MPRPVKKVKSALQQAMKAENGVEVQLYSFLDHGVRWGWVASVTPRPLYPQERDPVPILQEAGWVWTGEEISPPGFDPRTVQAVANRYTD